MSFATWTYVDLVAPLIDLQWAPLRSQRYHWKAYAIAPEPVHVPVYPVRRAPCFAVPITVGGSTSVGPAGAIGRVARLNASWADAPTVAWTTARTAKPMSSGIGMYEADVAPGIGAHRRPFGLQRCHW